MARAVRPIVQMQQEEESNVNSNVSCGWSALEVKVTLTFHMKVSGDCRRKRNQDSRGRRGRDAVPPPRASLTTQEAKNPGRDGEAAALRWKSLESRFKCRWNRARAETQTDREGGLSDRRVETGNKAGDEGPGGSRDDNYPAPEVPADWWDDVCGWDPQNTLSLENLHTPSSDEAEAQQCGRVQHRAP